MCTINRFTIDRIKEKVFHLLLSCKHLFCIKLLDFYSVVVHKLSLYNDLTYSAMQITLSLFQIIQAGVSPLPDNDPRDKYLYEITLYTGSRKGAGKNYLHAIYISWQLVTILCDNIFFRFVNRKLRSFIHQISAYRSWLIDFCYTVVKK